MSKRLNYLAKARPEAATAYLTFLKESGKYLDDKTRFLISVVTKVVAGTAPGLKQYVPHAMRCGASPNEIIDAVLMALPVAGLPKVLDALDQLQEIDPAFLIDNLFKEPEWYEVGPINDFPKDQLVARDIEGYGILVYNGPELKVYDRKCPHLGNRLPQNCDGNTMTCPSHKWSFDLPTGQVVDIGGRDLHTVPFEIENGVLRVQLLILK